VAALLGLDRTTLTANLKPLERRGLVSDAVDDADGRTRRLVLTQAGRSLLATAVPAWRREHAAIERRLPEGRADRLRADLITLAGTEEPPG
ncbi:MAG TPA: MarR family winged helix-turn-helix transcriptional regulator, partial [Acetobacteraceae bacterium]|nr:MarR family winged helix-turn-helix transcriptional regulator [Acetobacteraceae bacterium]